MLNYLWLALVVGAVVLGGLSDRLPEVTSAAFEACKTAVMTIALPLAGVMALWLGVMRLAEKAGLVQALARVLMPVLRRLFPDVPRDHPAMGSMVMNVAANMLGLANAATPLGLRAMRDLETLNRTPGVATNAMCTFLAINTSSVQLVPATVVAILAAAGSAPPTAIIGTAFVATLCSTAVGLTAVRTLERLPVFALPQPSAETAAPALAPGTEETDASAADLPALALWKRVAAIAALLFFAFLAYQIATRLGAEPGKSGLVAWVEAVSVLAIPFVLSFFPIYAALRGVPVYEEFVEGAKEGIQVAIRIIPFLVAILAAIGMFRAAGGIDALTKMLSPILLPIGFPPELLPLSLIRPLSGSGAMGVFSELVQAHGPDSLLARMGATLMGSTETTFYVIAVYFGSVGVKRSRHAVPAGLLADLAGIVASVAICRAVFA